MGLYRPGLSVAAIPCAVLLFCAAAAGQTATNRLTLSPGTENTNVVAGFHLQRGFRIELAATEPMVSAPVAMAFDENNRLYVAERRTSSGAAEVKPSPGRVRLLDDLDDKGRFRKSAVFAEDLAWPSALACYFGGVFVASVSEIIFLKDTDADGIADVRKVVFTGFGGTNTPDSRLLLNSFCWGLDNRIHGGAAGMGGAILASDVAGEPVFLEGSDFSFDPRTLMLLPEAGGAATGLSFDSLGRRLVSSSDHPLRLTMGANRYWFRNPFYLRASPFIDIISPAAAIYSLHIDPKPGDGQKPAGTNRVSAGSFKAPQGLVMYRGNIFPTNYAENAFLCDPENHAIHRVLLQERGIELFGTRAATEQKTEFLLSGDSSFRPVQAANGPDGALYVADARDGEQGRIYRIVPENFVGGKPVKLGGASTYDLVVALAHANGWHRDTAARLLYEKHDPTALPLLSNMVSNSQFPLAKIHALHALAGSGLLREAQVVKGLQDKDARVRQHALRVSEALATGGLVPEAVWTQMKKLSADTSIQVRCQLAFTAGASRRGDKALLLAQLLRRDVNNPWVQDAVMSSLGDGAGNMLIILAGDKRFRSDPVGLGFLRRLGTMIGVKGSLDDVAQVLDFVSRSKLEQLQVFALVHAIGDGLHRTGSSLALVDSQGVLQPLFYTALLMAIDTTIPESLRTEAVKLVSVSPYTYADTSDWLLLIANPQPLGTLRSVAVSALTAYDEPALVPALLEQWSGFPPQIRRQAATQLLSRANRVPAVMSALERGAIPAGDLFSPTLNFLRTYPDPAVSQRAVAAFGAVPFRRPAVVDQFKPSLRLAGDMNRGRELFNMRCAQCHQMRSTANRLAGPELAGVRANGPDRLLTDIVEPNLRIDWKYRTWVIETPGGELAMGVKADDNPESVTLLQDGRNAAVWPRLNIRAMRAETWSLMPDGLEQGFSTQNMADLLEYLMKSQEF